MFSINKITSSSPVDFAAEELKKYLRMMMPEGGDVKIAYAPDARDGFRLGLMSDFGLDTSDTSDTELDDIVYMDCDESGGIIAGSNARSVLLAVYEYLRQLGCRWLFPGVDGEYIPMKDITPVKYRHKADSRIRGNCIEGSASQKLYTDFIDFMPKVGLNTFMIQFRVPKHFYAKYYNHENNNVTFPPESITVDGTVQWTAALECEINKRGILLHSYGHGFTTDPFGIDSAMGWNEGYLEDYPEGVEENLALLSGKRDFYNKKPLNTQLCMSNPKTRRKVVEYLADYSERHSNIDVMQIWLADGSNNHCECEECRKMLPADWYVMLLNEIDEELSARSSDLRVVFIVYVDTFWAPKINKIKNPGRFTVMMAPITRDFSKPYDKNEPEYVTPPYERNRLVMPNTLEKSIAHFKEWERAFSGDSFVFEYHFWRPQHFDLSGRELASFIYNDICAYRELGFDGVMECGSQRSFYPNGFAFYTHARAQFDSSLSLAEIEEDYYCHAYGDGWRKFSAVLEDLSRALPYSYLYPGKAQERSELYATADSKERFAAARALLPRLRELVTEYYDSDVRLRTVSVRLLEVHVLYTEYYIRFVEKKAAQDEEGAEKAFEEFNRRVGALEKQTEVCLDIGQAMGIIKRALINLKISTTE